MSKASTGQNTFTHLRGAPHFLLTTRRSHCCAPPPQGHRIRIDVASSNFPRYDLNFGLGPGEKLQPETQTESVDGKCGNSAFPGRRTTTNTVFFDASRPSQLLLPLRYLRDDAGETISSMAVPPSSRPLIPFSSRWRQRRPTWSR